MVPLEISHLNIGIIGGGLILSSSVIIHSHGDLMMAMKAVLLLENYGPDCEKDIHLTFFFNYKHKSVLKVDLLQKKKKERKKKSAFSGPVTRTLTF